MAGFWSDVLSGITGVPTVEALASSVDTDDPRTLIAAARKPNIQNREAYRILNQDWVLILKSIQLAAPKFPLDSGAPGEIERENLKTRIASLKAVAETGDPSWPYPMPVDLEQVTVMVAGEVAGVLATIPAREENAKKLGTDILNDLPDPTKIPEWLKTLAYVAVGTAVVIGGVIIYTKVKK